MENRPPGETKAEGAVATATYVRYFKSLHSVGAAVFVLALFILCQVLFMVADWWLSYWSNKDEKSDKLNTTPPDRDMFLGVYAALVFGLLFITVLRSSVFFRLSLVASRNLHDKMLNAVLRVPCYFFDMNSIGRILNRFSKDTNYVDESLPVTLLDFLQTALMTIGVIVLVGANSPISFAIVVPILIVFLLERLYYIRTARDLKRLDGITRSPLYGHFSTTLLGLDTIRAFNAKETFIHEFHHYLESNTRALFAYICVSSWLTFRLEIMSAVFVSFVALISPALRSSLTPGVVGLILTYATKLSSVLAKTIKRSTELENMMTAVERMIEYCDLESEAPDETDVKPPKDWPSEGNISFHNVSYAHRPGLPTVLKGVNLHFKAKQKIGIVGRTGAGKSSLLDTLFRMAEPEGRIEIDGIDIKSLGLRDLRKNIAIIPQDPILFSSTLRRNIDAYEQHEDVDIWNALDEVQLKRFVENLPKRLETQVSSVGTLFSLGQRQLLCVARAILRHSKVVVIDEATANVDAWTSKIIWDTITERFKDCTLITIAHRLFPVMDADLVVVLDAGRIKEIDTPYNLLQNPHSQLTHLVVDTGDYEERKLRAVAKVSHLKKLRAASEEKAVKRGDTEEEETGNKAHALSPVTQEAHSMMPEIEIQGSDSDHDIVTHL